MNNKQDEKKPKNKKKMLLIIMVILILLASAGAAYYFLIYQKQNPTAEEPPKQYEYAIEDSFVTNVKSSNKLFKTTIILVANKDTLEEYISSNEYVIRDSVLFILRSLTEDDIRSEGIEDRLRTEIPEALNETLDTDYFVSVYFSDFVMQ